MNKLSVCMIVKNEEKVLARCLKCVKKFADEIIVVDTGSKDRTKSIAKIYTNKVFDFEWKNDFALARNFAFEKATCEFVMWLDADDFVTDKDIKKILKLKENLRADTYMLKYQIAFDELNQCTFEYYRERILRNNEMARFSGFVHEAIVPFGKIVFEDIAIEHRKPRENTNKKRNLNLYRYHIKNGEKLSARETFYYARELYFNDYYKKTLIILKRFLKMPNRFLPNIIDAHILISDCYLKFDDTLNAKKWLIKSFEYLPPNALISCKLGNLYVREKDYDSAIFWYKSALISSKNLKSGAFIENDYYDFYPYLQLSFCHYNIGDYKNFVYYHNLAKKIKPYDKSIIHNQQFVDKLNIES